MFFQDEALIISVCNGGMTLTRTMRGNRRLLDRSTESTGFDERQKFHDCVQSGIEKFKQGNLEESLSLFDKAQMHNSIKAPQPLAQRGIALYIAGEYEKANIQLKQDIDIIENARLYKASDLRLWRSAALNKLGRRDQAVEALDMNNIAQNGLLYEDKYVMNSTLSFFAGVKTLEDIMEVIGSTDEKGLCGNSFFGNFYIGLYFDSTDQEYFAKSFLSIPLSSSKYPTTDMWFHIPKLLARQRGLEMMDED